MASGISYISKTKSFLYGSTLLHEPFNSFFPLLSYILAKDLGASALQIVLFVMLQPVAAIFSFYWSELVSQNRHTLKTNLLGAGLLARLPFLFAIWTGSIWAVIAGSSIYMLFCRAAIPAWMEMLKLNLPRRVRERVFSVSTALGYGEGALIAIALGSLLDHNVNMWRPLFSGAILLGLCGVIIQVCLPIRKKEVKLHSSLREGRSFREALAQPWRDGYHLMKTRSDFCRFQWAFMFGGFGLMMLKPVLPLFLAEKLHISYCELTFAYSICKALGIVLASNLWGRAMSKISIASFINFVLIGFAVYPLLIFLGIFSIQWIFIAFFVYGIAQAGSHLIWHLSGPIFAHEEDSSRFSGVNIMTVGVRGAVGPPFGGLLCALFGPVVVLMVSSLFCISGTFSMLYRVPQRLSQPERS